MKVVYPVCCGIDVHKTFLVGTIISTTNGVQPNYRKKRFSTYNRDLHRFADWLHMNNCLAVCMESTGKYWVPVFNILEEREIRVTIANPKWVKAVKGNKDDTKDSKWIGDLFRLGLVPGSFIPPKDIRILREFTRYRYKLVSMKSSEKNRFQNAFTVCNVALDSVVSDMFGNDREHFRFRHHDLSRQFRRHSDHGRRHDQCRKSDRFDLGQFLGGDPLRPRRRYGECDGRHVYLKRL